MRVDVDGGWWIVDDATALSAASRSSRPLFEPCFELRARMYYARYGDVTTGRVMTDDGLYSTYVQVGTKLENRTTVQTTVSGAVCTRMNPKKSSTSKLFSFFTVRMPGSAHQSITLGWLSITYSILVCMKVTAKMLCRCSKNLSAFLLICLGTVLFLHSNANAFPLLNSDRMGGFRCRGLVPLQESEEAGCEDLAVARELPSPNVLAAACKFKIVTCMSTSCCKKRQSLGMDVLSTFGAMYSRSSGSDNDLAIRVEEGPCLGSCAMAPCVGVEHDDFVGAVALDGMTDEEFAKRA